MFPVVDVARGEHVAPRLQGVFPNNTQFAARRELPSKSEVDTPSIEIYIVLRGVVRIEIDKLSFMEFRVGSKRVKLKVIDRAPVVSNSEVKTRSVGQDIRP